jgi:hypothetical protein
MFRNNTAPVAEPAHDMAPADDLVPVSHLGLDLDVPVIGWAAYLKGRGIPIVLDSIGRSAISCADAKQLFDEQRAHECRQREAAVRTEQAAIAADKAWRSQLPVGLPWYDVPAGLLPVVAMTATAREEAPRKRSMVEDLLDRSGDTMVFHPITDEEAS